MDDLSQDRRFVLIPRRRSRAARVLGAHALPGHALSAALGFSAALALSACSAQTMPAVGVSAPRAPEAVAEAVDAGSPAPPPVAADFRSHMTRLSARFLSHGHADRFDAVIWGDTQVAFEAGADDDYPEGTVFVEEAIVHDTRGDRPFGLLVMTKEKDAFRFDAVDPSGRVEPAERVASCTTCHRDAAHFVFPWRRPGSP